jgi:exosome complex RNA-binding protein Rrp4
VIVVGSIARENVAVTFVETETFVAPEAGDVDVTVGALTVVNVHEYWLAIGVPSDAVTAVVIVAV